MSYKESFKIRNYQIGEDSTVKNSMLAKFMQHMATVDLEDNFGWSRARLLSNDMCFILIRTAICNYEDIRLGDVLEMETCPDGISEAFFVRRFIGRVEGKTAFAATTLWCVINPKTRRVLRPKATGIDLESERTFTNDVEPPKRVLPSDDCEKVGEYRVRYSDIDCNKHMNNTVYFDIIDDFLPDPFAQKVSFVKIEYAAEVGAGENLVIYRSHCDEGIYHMHAIRESDGRQCFLAKVETAKKHRRSEY